MNFSANVIKISLLSLTLTILVTCQKRNFNSGGNIKESLGRFNSPESLGLSANALDWENVRNETRGERAQAWSDTWWPHYSKGLADRYLLRKTGTAHDQLGGRVAVISKYVEQYLQVIQRRDPKELALLSPAEKYDFLMTDVSISENDFAKLRRYSQNHSDTKAEVALMSLERKLERLGEYDDSYKSLNQEYAREAQSNAPIFMPLLKEGLELSHELKKSLPLTMHDWNLWLDTFSWAHSEEWAWMGICNGWSPAALREQKPLQSVMVIRGDRRVLMTEGDIRGLLSWAWGWQFPNQTLGAGVRCDASESRTIVKNRRIIDGRLCEGKGSRPGRCVSANTIFIGKDDQFASVPGRTVQFGFEPQSRNSHEAKLTALLGNAYYEAEIKNLKTGEKRAQIIQITHACRDMNPGLFHAALVDLVARRKLGFVVDADRYTQVWNQPVFAYEMSYLPLMKKDGVVAAPGTLVPVAEVKDDIYSEFRAEKTSSLVQVRTKVIYASENGPFAKYDASGKQETSEELVADYTLEIDKKGKIIGGEWGLLPGTPGVKPLRASNASAPVAPDFIWNYPENTKPDGELLDYQIVKKIHSCSLSKSKSKTFDLSPWVEQPLAYVECEIN